MCLVAVGGVIFVVLAALLNVAADVGQDPRQRTALRALFWSAVHVLNVTAKVLIVVGAVISFAAALAGGGAMAERVAALVERGRATLADPRAKALAAAVAIGLGVLGLIWPLAMAEVLVRVGAVGLVVLGTVWVFDLVGASSWVAGETGAAVPRRFTPRRLALGGTTGVATFSLVLLLGGMSFVRAVRAPDLDRRNIDEAGCNGFVELCDRRIDEVAFAGTHNSMAASSEEGWVFGRQTGGLLAQLSFGVRAFLLDLHYGAPIKDLIRTDFLTPAEQALSDKQMGPKERAALERAIGVFGGDPDPDDRRVYLCHLYCELGATPAKAAFRELHDWLRVNPNEVILLVLEDHVEAEDAVEVLESSGLADRAYAWTAGSPAPTMRQLIETKKNVIVLAENHGGAVAHWYNAAYDKLLQDTPYGFASVEKMAEPSSCALKRGKRSAPLLLLNHWLDTGGLPPRAWPTRPTARTSCSAGRRPAPSDGARSPTSSPSTSTAKATCVGSINRLNRVDVPEPVLAATPGLPS